MEEGEEKTWRVIQKIVSYGIDESHMVEGKGNHPELSLVADTGEVPALTLAIPSRQICCKLSFNNGGE